MNGFIVARRLSARSRPPQAMMAAFRATGAGWPIEAETGQLQWVVASEYDVEARAIKYSQESYHSWMAVGFAHLSNREAVLATLRKQSGNVVSSDLSDLRLVLTCLAERGLDSIKWALGEFAIVAWDLHSTKFIAARDSFGIEPLYYRYEGDTLLMSSHASALAMDGRYDPSFVAEFLVAGGNPERRTVFRNVREVPPATTLSIVGHDHPTWNAYWSADGFSPDTSNQGASAVEKFRQLLIESVQSNLAPDGSTWSHLSGGLDSSTLVSVAQWLFVSKGSDRSLGGTVSFIDDGRIGHLDERDFSGTVVAKYGVRNVQLQHGWPWRDDGEPPPLTDQPTISFPLYARDRMMARVASEGGCKSLWSGEGPDLYLATEALDIADLLGTGQILGSLRLAHRWAAATRRSIWRCIWQNGIVPLAPSPVRKRALGHFQLTRWLRADFVRSTGMQQRTLPARRYTAPAGGKYRGAVLHDLACVQQLLTPAVVDRTVRMAYPYLYRPLVEFSLSLAPSMRTQPLFAKAVLREATVGILPDKIRLRTGKGGFGARAVWALRRERARIRALLKNPILAELGCVEPRLLQAAERRTRRGSSRDYHLLFAALALEGWLSVRERRWPEITASILSSPSPRHEPSEACVNAEDN